MWFCLSVCVFVSRGRENWDARGKREKRREADELDGDVESKKQKNAHIHRDIQSRNTEKE